MKYLIVLACAFVATNALSKEFVEKFMAELQQIGAKCTVETKASGDDIAELMAHNVPASHEGKCMIFCFYKHYHVQNDEGALSLEGATKSMEPLKADDEELYNKMIGVFKICHSKAVIDADPCITAAAFATCVKEESKNAGLTSDMLEF